MSLIVWLAPFVLGLAALPVVLTLLNLPLYRPARAHPPARTGVSVLIPARDEAETIGGAVEACLANRDVPLEIVVLDDQSSDATPRIVEALARRDPRVRLERAPPLPPGWSGKQHACRVLAARARHDLLLFQDADVRLAPDAVGRIAGVLVAGDAALVSGFPRQETGSAGEALLVPLMHFLIMGYLPIAGVRLTRLPGFGAACGQLVAVRRGPYERAGGHAAIRASLHDGLTLPRAFRRAGFRTDLFDATDLATCRMYRGWRDAWTGFSKNATEGMATPLALPVWTVLLGGGHVLPWLLLPFAAAAPPATAWMLAGAAAAGPALRLALAYRFRQPPGAALLHPLGIVALLAIQWSALVGAWRGRPSTWRGRAYPTGGA